VRYIDLDLLVGDLEAQPAIDAADLARESILAEPEEEARDDLIDAHRKNWVAFRAHFERVFGRKCWYIECNNPGTDDDIDHYRPKGRLAEDETHGGYWWEALHWRNFRLSCHRANRLRGNPDTGGTHGKGDHFPLLQEAERCRVPADDIYREHPTLLDPTEPGDPSLLTFDIDGSTAVAPEYENDSDARRRVDDSRVYLHLDWPAFKEERQELYRSVYTKVLDGDRASERFDRGEHAAKDALKVTARDLIRMTGNKAPYSRAARAYVKAFRDRGWVKQLVIPNIEAA
jgi:uncharacterized protein (TIGR02646 family)